MAMSDSRPVAVQTCTAERPMPRGTSPRELVRWEHPETVEIRGDLTRRTYHCKTCGLTVSVPKG